MLHALARKIFMAKYASSNYDPISEGIPEIDEATSGPCNEIVWHYTNFTGLNGIIPNREIWATSVFHMNDEEEFLHTFSLFHRQINALRDPSTGRHLLPFYLQHYADKLPDITNHCAFAACFSTERDLLSQWRAYSDQSDRLSIAFSGEQLRILARKLNQLPPAHYYHQHQFSYVKVIYDDQTKINIIFQALNKFFALMNVNQDLIDFKDHEFRALADIFIFSLLLQFAVMFKDKSFAQEKEWRLVCLDSDLSNTLTNNANAPIAFRSGQYGLTPYLKINLVNDEPVHISSIISGLMVGPSRYPIQAKKTAEIFMAKWGLPNIVTSSAIPLR